MTFTLAIPFYNSLHDVKGILGLLKFVTSANVDWLIIDNGSTDPIDSFFTNTLRPKRLQYVRNPQNIGMVKTYQQIFSLAQTDLVAVIHNDVFIYQKNWDQAVAKAFQTIPKLGCLGFFGAAGCGPIGERIHDPEFAGQMAGASNLLEAKQHGRQFARGFTPAAILDGFAMVFSRPFLKDSGGLDQRYHYHHLYDRDLPLTALSLGYKNVILPIPCHHQSGVTANRPAYQAWVDKQVHKKSGGDDWTHRQNSKLFAHKWAHALPLYIEPDFSFRSGHHGSWDFRGPAILSP